MIETVQFESLGHDYDYDGLIRQATDMIQANWGEQSPSLQYPPGMDVKGKAEKFWHDSLWMLALAKDDRRRLLGMLGCRKVRFTDPSIPSGSFDSIFIAPLYVLLAERRRHIAQLLANQAALTAKKPPAEPSGELPFTLKYGRQLAFRLSDQQDDLLPIYQRMIEGDGIEMVDEYRNTTLVTDVAGNPFFSANVATFRADPGQVIAKTSKLASANQLPNDVIVVEKSYSDTDMQKK